jgi:hypothetical protein
MRVAVLVALFAASLGGCVSQSISIRSVPPEDPAAANAAAAESAAAFAAAAATATATANTKPTRAAGPHKATRRRSRR